MQNGAALRQGQGPHYALEWMFVLRVFSSDRKSIFPSGLKDFFKVEPKRFTFGEWSLGHLPFSGRWKFSDLLVKIHKKKQPIWLRKNDEDVLLPFVRTAKADNKGPGRLVSSRVEETKQITGFMSDREVSLNLSQPATM